MLMKIYCWLLAAVVLTSFLSSGLTLVLVPFIGILIAGEAAINQQRAGRGPLERPWKGRWIP